MKSKRAERRSGTQPEPRPFHRTTWSRVKAGAVVLMAWGMTLGEIVEVTITECDKERSTYNGRVWIIASFDPVGDHYPRRLFGPRRVVYARSKS